MMLSYTFYNVEGAQRIEDAVGSVLDQGLRTVDISSEGMQEIGTAEMGNAVIAAMRDGK